MIKECDICNYADDNTIYCCDDDLSSIMAKLKLDLKNALNLFKVNCMVANPSKFKIFFLGTKKNNLGLTIESKFVPCVDSVRILGVQMNTTMDFKEHIKEICSSSNKKVNALIRIRNFINK